MSHLVQRVEKLDGVGEVVGPLEPVVSKVCPSRIEPQDDDLRLRHAVLHDVEHLLKSACRAAHRIHLMSLFMLRPGPTWPYGVFTALPLPQAGTLRTTPLALEHQATH